MCQDDETTICIVHKKMSDKVYDDIKSVALGENVDIEGNMYRLLKIADDHKVLYAVIDGQFYLFEECD